MNESIVFTTSLSAFEDWGGPLLEWGGPGTKATQEGTLQIMHSRHAQRLGQAVPYVEGTGNIGPRH